MKYKRRMRIKRKIKTKIRGTRARLRLSAFRSNKIIYAQIVDDEKGKTLVAASERELALTEGGPKTEKAKLVGKLLARKALKEKIKTVVFDRGRWPYHGRIKALAEGAREEGLVF